MIKKMLDEYDKTCAKEDLHNLMRTFDSLKDFAKRNNEHLYNRWKYGGFAIDPNFVSMYPAVEEVIEKILENEIKNEDS
jgi:hypothetical protein